MLRRCCEISATAAATYLAIRVAEEQMPFRRIDLALGTRGLADEEIRFWRATNPIGGALPSAERMILQENEASSHQGLAVALADTAVELGLSSHQGAGPAFRVFAQASQVPGSGLGAHVVGHAPRGCVLCFYQGPIYAPWTGRLALMMGSGRTSEYKLVLSDSYIADGQPSRTMMASMCAPRANHPPADVTPNAMFYTACCDADALPAPSAAALRRASWYASAPLTFDGARRVRVTFAVALRDLDDEEIYVDYRYDSDAPTPEWYTPMVREGQRPRRLTASRDL